MHLNSNASFPRTLLELSSSAFIGSDSPTKESHSLFTLALGQAFICLLQAAVHVLFFLLCQKAEVVEWEMRREMNPGENQDGGFLAQPELMENQTARKSTPRK